MKEIFTKNVCLVNILLRYLDIFFETWKYVLTQQTNTFLDLFFKKIPYLFKVFYTLKYLNKLYKYIYSVLRSEPKLIKGFARQLWLFCDSFFIRKLRKSKEWLFLFHLKSLFRSQDIFQYLLVFPTLALDIKEYQKPTYENTLFLLRHEMPEDEFGKYFYKYFKNQIELDYQT